ncbi:MAG: small basic protein [Planctomycetota bacterium]
MSMDRSLRSKSSLSRHRNVLTRTERIENLIENEKFTPSEDRPVGLPKVAHRKVPVGGKTKKKEAKEGEGEEAAEKK